MPSPDTIYIHDDKCNAKEFTHSYCCDENGILLGKISYRLKHPKECLQPQEDHPKCPTFKDSVDVIPSEAKLNSGSQGTNSYRIPFENPKRFDLIPPLVLQQLAEVYEEGAQSYGDSKYLEKPLPYSVIVNHMMNHLLIYLNGDRSELHLAKVIWGAASMITLDQYDGGINNDMFFGGKKPNVIDTKGSSTN